MRNHPKQALLALKALLLLLLPLPQTAKAATGRRQPQLAARQETDAPTCTPRLMLRCSTGTEKGPRRLECFDPTPRSVVRQPRPPVAGARRHRARCCYY